MLKAGDEPATEADRLLDDASYFIETFVGVEPFDYQKEFMNNESNRKAFVSGRRVGKSRTASWIALHKAATTVNSEVLITAPSQRQSSELFNQIKKEIRKSEYDESQWGITGSTRTEINFQNGSRIKVVPLGTDGSNVRGYGVDLLLVDEAAFVKDVIIEEVLLPMLAFGDGTLILLSTPHGKKGYLYRAVEDFEENPNPEWFVKQVPTSANPGIKPEFIENQKKRLSNRQFKQEYLGQFDEKSDSFFTREELMNCATGDRVDKESNICYLGVDLASTGGDDSVFVSVDEDGNIFDIKHTTDVPLTKAMEKVRQLDNIHNYTKIMIDATGLGEGVVHQLQDTIGNKVEGFKFTNESKQSLYNTLKNAFQQGNLSYRFEPGKEQEENFMVNQCLDLSYSYTSTQKLKIHHPSGKHDDYSDALALAVWAKSRKSMARSDDSMKPFDLGSLR